MKKYIYTTLGTLDFDEIQIPPKSLENYSDTPEEAECKYYVYELEKYYEQLRTLDEKHIYLTNKINKLNDDHSHLKHLFPEKFI